MSTAVNSLVFATGLFREKVRLSREPKTGLLAAYQSEQATQVFRNVLFFLAAGALIQVANNFDELRK
jgi:hypothetical protein